jgi:hypothetical protein
MSNAIATMAVLCALVCCTTTYAAAPPESSAAIRERLQFNGHLAKYALMAVLEFSSEQEALRVKEALERGRLGLHDAMQKQAESRGKARAVITTKNPGLGGRSDADHDSSATSMGAGEDLSADGLMTVDDVHPAVAEAAFDVRNPTAGAGSPNPIGPVRIGPGTHALAIVFMRYRRGFFSDEWFEVEAFAKENGLPFKDLLRDLEDVEASKYLVFQIWPNDDIAVKRLKLATVKANLARVGTYPDPSALPQAANVEPPHEDVDEMLSQRRSFFAHVPDWVKEEHPEVFGMDLDDIVAAGLGPGAMRDPNARVPDSDGEPAEERAVPDGQVDPAANGSGGHDEF